MNTSKTKTIVLYAVFCTTLFDVAMANCRVLADCDNGQATWKDLSRGATGRPGKRGMKGPVGQTGEQGLGVNITELRSLLRNRTKGPKLYYYVSTLTWQTSKSFCQRYDRNLCTSNQLCIRRNGTVELIDDVLSGDHWVAVLDSHNEWVEIGDFHGNPCFLHSQRWGKPNWGITTEVHSYKGHVYCCNRVAAVQSEAPDVRYQFIGKAATYSSSVAHCVSQGRRLCYSWEACKSNNPVLGSVKGDKWIAVQDRHNEWLQIGNSLGKSMSFIAVVRQWGMS